MLKPLQGELEGKPAACIQDDAAHLGEPSLFCKMLTLTMPVKGQVRQNLAPAALEYGERRLLFQSERNGDQAPIDSDVDVTRLNYEGTMHLPTGVNRGSVKFAGLHQAP